VFAPALRRLIVPAGRTGLVDLVDPATGAVESITGFTRSAGRTRGHSVSATSADAGQGQLFAIDRDARALVGIDLSTRRAVARMPLGGGPDYVRWIAPDEVWVTEPAREAIEIFRFEAGPPPSIGGRAGPRS
jgi:hypothetical protein